MRIRVMDSSRKLLGVIVYERGEASFTTDQAKTIFEAMKNKPFPRPALSVDTTVTALKSWSNGYVITEVEKS